MSTKLTFSKGGVIHSAPQIHVWSMLSWETVFFPRVYMFFDLMTSDHVKNTQAFYKIWWWSVFFSIPSWWNDLEEWISQNSFSLYYRERCHLHPSVSLKKKEEKGRKKKSACIAEGERHQASCTAKWRSVATGGQHRLSSTAKSLASGSQTDVSVGLRSLLTVTKKNQCKVY